MAGGDVRQIGRILSRWVFGSLIGAFLVFLTPPNLRRSLLLKHPERRGIYAYHEVDDITLFVLPTDPIEAVLIQSEQARDDDLVATFRLNPSGSLIFEKTQIADGGLAHLNQLKKMHSLNLNGAKVGAPRPSWRAPSIPRTLAISHGQPLATMPVALIAFGLRSVS